MSWSHQVVRSDSGTVNINVAKYFCLFGCVCVPNSYDLHCIMLLPAFFMEQYLVSLIRNNTIITPIILVHWTLDDFDLKNIFLSL